MFASGDHAETLRRFAELAALVSDGKCDQPDRLVDWVAGLTQRLGTHGLAAFGVRPGDYAEIAAKAAVTSSMKGNPVRLSTDTMVEVLAAAA